MFETAGRNEPFVPSSELLNRRCRHRRLTLLFTGGHSHGKERSDNVANVKYSACCANFQCRSRRYGRAHAHRLDSCKLSVADQGERCSPARLCILVQAVAVPRSLAAKEESPLERATKAPDSGRVEAGPTRRVAWRHDLRCEHGAGV